MSTLVEVIELVFGMVEFVADVVGLFVGEKPRPGLGLNYKWRP